MARDSNTKFEMRLLIDKANLADTIEALDSVHLESWDLRVVKPESVEAPPALIAPLDPLPPTPRQAQFLLAFKDKKICAASEMARGAGRKHMKGTGSTFRALLRKGYIVRVSYGRYKRTERQVNGA